MQKGQATAKDVRSRTSLSIRLFKFLSWWATRASMTPELMAVLGYHASSFPGKRSRPVAFLEIQRPIFR